MRVTVRPVSASAVERDEHDDQSSRFCSAGHAGGGPRYRGDGGIDPGDRLGRRSAGGDNVVSGINDLNPGNFDFGAILFDDNVLNTGASGADYLYDELRIRNCHNWKAGTGIEVTIRLLQQAGE